MTHRTDRLHEEGMPLPFTTALLPKAWKTLGQHRDGKAYIYRPSASGRMCPARLRRCAFDPSMFPELTRARPFLTVSVPRFRMSFHAARIFSTAAGRQNHTAEVPG